MFCINIYFYAFYLFFYRYESIVFQIYVNIYAFYVEEVLYVDNRGNGKTSVKCRDIEERTNCQLKASVSSFIFYRG